MIVSFLIGIISSAFIAKNGNLSLSMHLIVERLAESSGLSKLYSLHAIWTNWNLSIFIFLISLGILIVLLQQSGSTQAFIKLAQKKVKNQKSAEITSLLLSLIFFIDDYFSALTVGSIMRPLAHLYGLNSVKLAFLVTAMAEPIAILSPLSSWVGEIVGQLKQVGIGVLDSRALIHADPFYVFLMSIPFIFYAIFMIISTWYIVLRGISYGPMAYYDNQKNPTSVHVFTSDEKQSASLIDFVFPIFFLISSVFIMLLITGDISWFGGMHTFSEAIKNGSIQQAFLVGGLSSVIVSFLFFLARNKITLKMIGPMMWQGIQLMIPSLLMLVHVWALSMLLKQDLQTGSYIASMFSSFVNTIFFPAGCFIVATLIAWMIGSAWGTIGLMFPIVIPMLKTIIAIPEGASLDAVPLLLPIIGATLSGCVMGTHISLISDNPIMASASCGAEHFELIKSMIWYVVPVGIATALSYCVFGISFTACGFFKSLLLSLFLGIFTVIIIFELIQYYWLRLGNKKIKQ